jgi:hypothetical protein
MSERILIEVSDQVARYAAVVAAQTRQRVEEVLAQWLDSAVNEMPVDILPEAEVMALAEHQLSADQQQTLSELLVRNHEDKLDGEGRRKLDELMRVHERGLLRKAQALRVAVERGLREPLQA